MKQAITIKGKWFLPNRETEAAVGTLTFEPNKGAELTLDSALPIGIPESGRFIDLIYGKAYDGKMVTLHQSYALLLTPFFDEDKGGIGITQVSVNYFLVGDSFPAALKFDRIRMKLRNFEEWLSIYGFDELDLNVANDPPNIKVSYTLPAKINFLIDNSIHGEVLFSVTPTGHKYTNHLQITQKNQVVLKLPELADFDKCFEYMTHFQSFLTLGTFETSYLLQVKLGNSQQIDEAFSKYEEYELYFSNRATVIESSHRQWHEFLFSYRDIQNNYSRIISKWFQQAVKIEPILNILLESFYSGDQFNENNFLNMAQALETFHRRFREVPKIPKEVHKRVVDEIISNAPEAHKDWLEAKLRFAYEPTLDERITDLLNEVPDRILSAIVQDKDNFKIKIKQSRNYYTHYGEGLEKKALRGGELFFLTEKMRAILVVLILLETSFTKEEVIGLFERTKHRLFRMILVKTYLSVPKKEHQ